MWTEAWTEVLPLAAVILGVSFMFVASIGVLRMPDFILRIHAPTKASTLGLMFLLLALALHAGSAPVVTKALLALLFIGVTAPVGAHILARTGQRTGVGQPPSPGSPADRYGQRREQPRTDPLTGGAAAPTTPPDVAPSGEPEREDDMR